MVEHDCQECGVRQRVDGLAGMGDREQAIAVVLEKCANCTQHPSADFIGQVHQMIGKNMTDNWVQRVE